jgi:hypothetical protein
MTINSTNSTPEALLDEIFAKAWKVEVIADSSGKWCSNGLTFPTKIEAETYARELASRWTLVREWRAVPV